LNPTGAYVGAILFLVTAGIIQSFVDPQSAAEFSASESLRDLFSYPLAGIILLSWWIALVGVFFGVYFDPRLAQWPGKAAVMRGILLGAARQVQAAKAHIQTAYTYTLSLLLSARRTK
jgi:hypothetical protein